MPTTLPTPIEFRLPQGWLPAQPEGFEAANVAFAAVHPQPDAGFAANITIDGEIPPDAVTLVDLANSSVERLREVAESVTVSHRREVGSADAPALTQRLTFSTVVDDTRRDLVQSQVYLSLSDIGDPHKRAVIRLALTATAAQHDAVLGAFQDFVRTVRPDTGEEV
ncbi:hypothetical protein [Streptomyces resistomycificus]|uniref:DUF1795 domain-containing protein n=1 Tax=Streptomyces resistomycificus TaxID=67356 RepID=A0A0L8KUS6_9ACTN|nr:hypothetical protein [Streptomyces resistomycificus]KOG29632.1 hypothetical protein ADK37_36050 [Streptomyces resistomycificus]KUN90640.1 hypothetical protein AQJ84_39005 [Streptomyces resistomycificus]